MTPIFNKAKARVGGTSRLLLCAKICAVLLLTGFSAYAQEEELSEISAGGLLQEATKMLGSQQYASAVPYLTEYLNRMGTVDEPEVKDMMQEVRLKMAKISAYLQDSFSAVKYLQEYTEQLPRYKPREAYKLLALNLYEMGEYEQCVGAATNALAQPLPQGLKESKKADFDEMSKKDMGGFTARQLKRIEKEAAEAEEEGGDLAEGFGNGRSKHEPELPYTTNELVTLNMTLAQSYTALEKWEPSLKPYQFVIDNATAEDRKGYAILQMVNSLVALERYKEAGDFVSQLYATDARYDIRVNMALMSAGVALFNAEQYDSALKLYRMVLPRGVLVAFQEKKMNEIRRYHGLPDVEITVSTNEVGRVETIFGDRDTLSATVKAKGTDEGGFGSSLPAKPEELFKLEEAVQTVISLAPYEDEVLFRTGEVYGKVNRPWEAVTAFGTVSERDPDGQLGDRAFSEKLLVLVDPLKEYKLAENLGKQYLASHKEGLGPREVAYALTMCYQQQGHWQDVKTLLSTIEQFVPSQNKSIRQYECELYYMQAIADMMLMKYKEAGIGFAKVINDFKGLQEEENATYWHALCGLFMKDYEQAYSELEAYIANYKDNGAWLPSAAFYRGVSLFGLEKNDEAKQAFTYVINTYPDSSVYPDACSMRGDLFGAEGLLDEAKADYDQAIASAKNVKQGTYPVFQLASMFELEEKYDEIISTVHAYLDRYGEEADVAKAAYWIGKTKLAQGKTGEALQAYRDAVVTYGGDIMQDGVDLIINELVATSQRLKAEDRDTLLKNLRTSLVLADNETLKLRLRVLIAKIEGTELELGKQLIAEVKDLDVAPPPVLAVICEASFESRDYSRSAEILDIFQRKFDESEFIGAAYKLRGYDLFASGDLEGAMSIVKSTQEIYGTQTDVAWAQIMKGRIELQQGDLGAARETFRAVFNVRGWRGEPYAEATYYLGKVEEGAGNLRAAHAWYQRLYVQYKGYAQGAWAAKGYLSAARCLSGLQLDVERRNTLRAMLFDKYVNQLPEADEARTELGTEVTQEIEQMIEQGIHTNLTVKIEAETPAVERSQEPKPVEEAPQDENVQQSAEAEVAQ